MLLSPQLAIACRIKSQMTNLIVALLPLNGHISVLQLVLYAPLSNRQSEDKGPKVVLKVTSHWVFQKSIPSQLGRGFPLAWAHLYESNN